MSDCNYSMSVTQDLMDCVIVKIEGVVAGDATPKFRKNLDEIVADENVRRIILVLDEMESMSPRAFGIIVSALIILASRQRKLSVVGPRDNFVKMMKMTGLNSVVRVFVDLHEARKEAW